jgi:predicted nucleic acid-binding protein
MSIYAEEIDCGCCSSSRTAATSSPRRRLEVYSDPDDNKFLECADAVHADYLITGNQKHSPKFWKASPHLLS